MTSNESAAFDLTNLKVFPAWRTKYDQNLASVEFSPSGTYFAAGTVGAVTVHRTDDKNTIRSHKLPGSVDVLKWVLINGDSLLIAGTSEGWVAMWKEGNETSSRPFKIKLKAYINDIAISESGTMMAISSGTSVVLYQGFMSSPSHMFSWTCPAAVETITNDFARPIATSLIFISDEELLMGYLLGYSVAQTHAPFSFTERRGASPPICFGRLAMAPSARYIVASSISRGFEIFSISAPPFQASNNYLERSSQRNTTQGRLIDIKFLTDNIFVAGGNDQSIHIFQLLNNGQIQEHHIPLGNLQNTGTLRLAVTFFHRRPVIAAITGKTLYFIRHGALRVAPAINSGEGSSSRPLEPVVEHVQEEDDKKVQRILENHSEDDLSTSVDAKNTDNQNLAGAAVHQTFEDTRPSVLATFAGWGIIAIIIMYARGGRVPTTLAQVLELFRFIVRFVVELFVPFH